MEVLRYKYTYKFSRKSERKLITRSKLTYVGIIHINSIEMMCDVSGLMYSPVANFCSSDIKSLVSTNSKKIY
jgi:hypothetical protein